MGADGGVCWVELRDGVAHRDLERLLALTAISNNLMVVEHRAGCTCEVWPDP